MTTIQPAFFMCQACPKHFLYLITFNLPNKLMSL